MRNIIKSSFSGVMNSNSHKSLNIKRSANFFSWVILLLLCFQISQILWKSFTPKPTIEKIGIPENMHQKSINKENNVRRIDSSNIINQNLFALAEKEIKRIENSDEDISKFKTLMKLYDQADIINDIV